MVPCSTELGKFLRTCRLNLGLSQQRVARQANIHQSEYGRIKLGKTRFVGPKRLNQLAFVLNCDARKLRELTPRRTEPKTELGKLIRKRREELGMGLVEFASEVRWTESSAGNLELRTLRLNPGVAYDIARVLNIEFQTIGPFIGARTKPTSSPLGSAIRDHRHKLGLTQRELAKRMNTSWQLVSQVELGNVPLSSNAPTLIKFAQAFGINEQELTNLKPPRKLKKPLSDPNTIGGFIAARRHELGLTLKQLGERSGTNGSYLSKIELGEYRPTEELLRRMAAALGCGILLEILH